MEVEDGSFGVAGEEAVVCVWWVCAPEGLGCWVSVKKKKKATGENFLQTLRSAEHAAMFCPDGSNLQLKISAWQKMRISRPVDTVFGRRNTHRV